MKSFMKCCICFTTTKLEKDRDFYQFPRIHNKHSCQDKLVIEKRIIAWSKVTDAKAKNKKGMLYVCSHHFVSGKPSYFMSTCDVDWVPTLNLGSMGQLREPLPSFTEKPLASDGAQVSQKSQRSALSNSNQMQGSVEQTPELEPLKKKTVYCRPIQPMNGGIWPRVTATIISPESINIAESISNLNACRDEPSVAVPSVSKNMESITVEKEMEDIADEADQKVHAAYCFTSKMTIERGTQVTADEIRWAFQSTATTQTLWK